MAIPPGPYGQETHFVTGCVGCSFHHRVGSEHSTCMGAGIPFDPAEALKEHDPPEWCPLREKKILVMIDELRVLRRIPDEEEDEFANRMRARRLGL